MEKMATIYRITNHITGATYIGQTTMTLEERWKNHIKEAEDNKLKPIYLAVKEYGKQNFTIEKIDETFFRHRFIVEQYYIEKELKKNNVCYNTNVKGKEFADIMSLVTKDSKNGMYGRKNENAINGQQVLMKDENDNIVKEFNTVGLVLKYLGLKGHNGLYKACKTGEKYRGYYWSKTNSNNL